MDEILLYHNYSTQNMFLTVLQSRRSLSSTQRTLMTSPHKLTEFTFCILVGDKITFHGDGQYFHSFQQKKKKKKKKTTNSKTHEYYFD